LEELNAAGVLTRLRFTLLEPQKQIKVTILDWSEQPISIPESLVRCITESLTFCQFCHFDSSSDRGSQPPTREYAESIPSGGETAPPSENLSKCQKCQNVKEAGEEPPSPQAENIERILEFIGKEGKPLREVLEYAVKGLGLLRPEPLLRGLLERGIVVKVKKGGETWLARG
jgi:hypothetical protein